MEYIAPIAFIAAISLVALEIAAEQCSEQERLAMTPAATLQKPCYAKYGVCKVY